MFSPSPDFEGSPGPLPPLCNVPPMAMPVITPSSNGQAFQSTVFQKPAERIGVLGTGTRGVDWLQRILMALQCPVQEEIEWAVSALLELSFRNADAFKQPGSEQALRLVLATITEHWDTATAAQTDLEERESGLVKRQFLSEALLTLRNACLDAKTAQLLAAEPATREVITRGMLLPREPLYSEIRGYAVEIAEHVCFHYMPEGPESPLMVALVNLLDSQDRSLAISSHRALGRLCVYDESNCIASLAIDHVHRLLRYLMVEDEELVSACLDLLYQYTARIQHVDDLVGENIKDDAMWVRDILSAHLVRLLTYKMDRERVEYVRLPRRTKRPAPAEPPSLPQTILDELLVLNEPERATNWIRASYEPDPDGEVTQISLWKAYEGQFEAHARQSGRRLLPAVDFIKNVTSAFRNAAAMVVNVGPNQKKFIIKGIRPREQAVSPSVYRNNPAALPDPRRRIPPPFGPTVALVLQNIARLHGGRQLLQPYIAAIADAAVVNPSLWGYVDALLSVIDKQK